MFIAKRLILCIALFSFMFTAGICLADSSIPNLLGKWALKGERLVVGKTGAPESKTASTVNYHPFAAEITIDKQQGRMFQGTFTRQNETEKIVGIIGMDNKTIHLIDEDGYQDAKIINKNRIQGVHRHFSPTEAAIAVDVWTRKK